MKYKIIDKRTGKEAVDLALGVGSEEAAFVNRHGLVCWACSVGIDVDENQDQYEVIASVD